MTWDQWIKAHRFTLYRTALIQKNLIDVILGEVPINSSLLETGMGSGVTAVLLKDLGYNVECMDNNYTVIEEFYKRYGSFGIKAYYGNLDDIKAYHKKYDCIYHQGILEHFFNDDDIISILKNQAKMSEKVIFDVPNSLRIQKRFEGESQRWESPKFWKNIVKKTGLKYKYYGRNIDQLNDWIPDKFKKYDSPLMKKIGRSSMFVCWKE